MDKFLSAEVIAKFTGGKNSVYEADELDITEAKQCINANLKRQNGIQPREGATILGSFSTTANPIRSAHCFTRKDGLERPLRSSGTILECYNPFLATPDYITLDTGFTSGKIFGFVDGDTVCYMCNGVEVIRKWTGAVARFDLANSTVNVIALHAETENGVTLSSAELLGFSSSGTMIINGNAYTYSGRSGLTLTGVNTTPLGEADLSGVAEKPISTGFTSAPLGNILLIKDSRLLIAGVSANPNNVYGSKIGDATNFSFSSPAVADDGFVMKFWGKPITALLDKGAYVAVLKEDGAKSLSFTKIGDPSSTSILTVPKIDGLFEGIGLGAVNQKSTLGLNYDGIFTSKQVGLRRLTRITGNDIDTPESLTERIQDDFDVYDLVDACIGAFKQQIHLGLRSSSDLNGNNLVILKDMLTGFIGTYSGINASCFFIYNNKLYFGDSFTKNTWQLYNGEYADFDGTNYYDYLFRWRSKFFHYNYPELFKELGYIFIEGYITPNTNAEFKINLETENGLQTITETLSGTANYVFKSSASSFGRKKFGEVALAPGQDNDLPAGAKKFYRIITPSKIGLSDVRWLKMQFELETGNAGDFIRLTKIRPMVSVLPFDVSKSNKILNNIT